MTSSHDGAQWLHLVVHMTESVGNINPLHIQSRDSVHYVEDVDV